MASETPRSRPAHRSGDAGGAERAAKSERGAVNPGERPEGIAAQRRPRAPSPGERPEGTGAQRRSRALRKVHWSLEQAVLGLVFLGGLPAALALAWVAWGQDYSFEVRWTLAAVVLAVWVG